MRPLCMEYGPSGYRCHRPSGHTGEHQADGCPPDPEYVVWGEPETGPLLFHEDGDDS